MDAPPRWTSIPVTKALLGQPKLILMQRCHHDLHFLCLFPLRQINLHRLYCPLRQQSCYRPRRVLHIKLVRYLMLRVIKLIRLEAPLLLTIGHQLPKLRLIVQHRVFRRQRLFPWHVLIQNRPTDLILHSSFFKLIQNFLRCGCAVSPLYFNVFGGSHGGGRDFECVIDVGLEVGGGVSEIGLFLKLKI